MSDHCFMLCNILMIAIIISWLEVTMECMSLLVILDFLIHPPTLLDDGVDQTNKDDDQCNQRINSS